MWYWKDKYIVFIVWKTVTILWHESKSFFFLITIFIIIIFAHAHFAGLRFMYIVSLFTATPENYHLFIDKKYICQGSIDNTMLISDLRKTKVYFLLKKILLWSRRLIGCCSWANSSMKSSGIWWFYSL